MVRLSKMFRPILAVFALVAIASAELDFINKCSLSAPDLEQCFVKNGNLALEQLSHGWKDLDIPSLDGIALGDLLFENSDLSLSLEAGKAYPRDVSLHNVRLMFDSEKDLIGLKMSFFVADFSWQAKYRALGENKVDEIGSTKINFGGIWVHFTLDFKREEVEDEYYLQAFHSDASIEYEKFEFVPRDVQAKGEKLKPEQYRLVEEEIVEKLEELSTEHVTSVFNRILLQIPEKEIFLP